MYCYQQEELRDGQTKQRTNCDTTVVSGSVYLWNYHFFSDLFLDQWGRVDERRRNVVWYWIYGSIGWVQVVQSKTFKVA